MVAGVARVGVLVLFELRIPAREPRLIVVRVRVRVRVRANLPNLT